MSKKGILAMICYILGIIIVMRVSMSILLFAVKQSSNITDEVCMSRNIYNVSMQEAEQYLREKNIEYTKDGKQLEVENVFFITENDVLTIDSEQNGTSYCVDTILNAKLSDTRQTFKNNETTYYLKNVRITEKDGNLKYYEDSIAIMILKIISYFVSIAIGGILLKTDIFNVFEEL